MRTILIVEDSETCAETLQIAFESMAGMKTVVLPSLGAALTALRNSDNNIAALVTDLHMPRVDGLDAGFELIRQLRAEDRYASLPVLLISGDPDPQLPE